MGIATSAIFQCDWVGSGCEKGGAWDAGCGSGGLNGCGERSFSKSNMAESVRDDRKVVMYGEMTLSGGV